ncbi:hypothetical protein Hanom_Chr01g00088451 [Helianthus anomalus]
METKSGSIVRDVVNKPEENSFGRYPLRFYEAIYQENLSEEEPRFDEDGIEPDEEECSLVQTLLNGTTIQENEHMKEANGNDHVYVNVSAGLFFFFYIRTRLLRWCSGGYCW